MVAVRVVTTSLEIRDSGKYFTGNNEMYLMQQCTMTNEPKETSHNSFPLGVLVLLYPPSL